MAGLAPTNNTFIPGGTPQNVGPPLPPPETRVLEGDAATGNQFIPGGMRALGPQQESVVDRLVNSPLDTRFIPGGVPGPQFGPPAPVGQNELVPNQGQFGILSMLNPNFAPEIPKEPAPKSVSGITKESQEFSFKPPPPAEAEQPSHLLSLLQSLTGLGFNIAGIATGRGAIGQPFLQNATNMRQQAQREAEQARVSEERSRSFKLREQNAKAIFDEAGKLGRSDVQELAKIGQTDEATKRLREARSFEQSKKLFGIRGEAQLRVARERAAVRNVKLTRQDQETAQMFELFQDFKAGRRDKTDKSEIKRFLIGQGFEKRRAQALATDIKEGKIGPPQNVVAKKLPDGSIGLFVKKGNKRVQVK